MHKAVGSKSILGGGLKNKFELLLHFSSSFVCVCLYKWNMGGGGGAHASPPTSDNLDM